MAQRIKCTYKTCNEDFDNEKQMKKHKHDSSEHVYCRRCDYDAEDWEDLLRHKTDEMVPYLYGTKELDREAKKRGEKIMHIVCEFCGEDFMTWSGREKHRNMYHQAAQDIVCKGSGPVYDAAIDETVMRRCDRHFIRPSDLIAHYEESECLFISSRDFRLERQQKHVVKQVLQNPDHFSKFMKQCKTTKDDESEKDSQDETAEWNDDDHRWGGARLDGFLDKDDPQQGTAGPSLQPRVNPPNLMDADAPISRATHEAWPRAVDSEVESMRSKFSKFSISPAASSVGSRSAHAPTVEDDTESMDVDGTPSVKQAHSPKSPLNTTEWPSRPESTRLPWDRQATLNSFMATHSHSSSTDSGSNSPTRTRTPTVEDDTNSEKATPNWSAINKSNAYTTRIDAQTNLFHSHWWDSSSPTYDPKLFYHVLLEAYACPFPSCSTTFRDPVNLSVHLRTYHTLPAIKCPLCTRKFDKVNRLMCHFESSERGSGCKIAKSRDYAFVLDEVTGGFLNVERMVGDKCVGYATRGKGENRVVFRFGEKTSGEKRGAGVQKAKYQTRQGEKKDGGGVKW